MPKVTIFTQSCKGVDDCGICAYVCPKQLFEARSEMNDAGYYPPEIKNPGECTGCGNCMIFCPDYAIVVESDEERPSNRKMNNKTDTPEETKEETDAAT